MEMEGNWQFLPLRNKTVEAKEANKKTAAILQWEDKDCSGNKHEDGK